MQKLHRSWLEKCNIFLDQNQLDVLEAHPKMVETFEKNGISYFVPNSNVASKLNTLMLYNLIKSKNFDLETVLRLLDTNIHSRIYIFSLFAQYQFYQNLPLSDLLSGSLNVQHYRLWRFFFSTYLYGQRLECNETIIRFLMYCIDYAFYFKHYFEINIVLTLLFEVVIHAKKNHWCFETLWNEFKQKDIFSSFEQAIYGLYAKLIDSSDQNEIVRSLCQKFNATFNGSADESFSQLVYEFNLWGGVAPKCQRSPQQNLPNRLIHTYHKESSDCIFY